jgi:hypothetical protein
VQSDFLHKEHFLKDRTKIDLQALTVNKNNWKPNMVSLAIISNIFCYTVQSKQTKLKWESIRDEGSYIISFVSGA